MQLSWFHFPELPTASFSADHTLIRHVFCQLTPSVLQSIILDNLINEEGGPSIATYRLQVNGQFSNLTIDDPSTPLLFILQENFQLNGPRFGCGLGQCGACTVLLDGTPIRSCITAISDADGHSVTSLEGLRALDGLPNPDDLHPIQQSFVDQQAMQCGYCVAVPFCMAMRLSRATRTPPAPISNKLSAVSFAGAARTPA